LLLHRKYHGALAALVRETFSRFGAAVVIDCHSMPSAAGTPDVVLGDRYGTAASHVLLRCAEQAFEARGFSVGRNVPYAGGYTTLTYGDPKRGIHALQVEINRALYLDEEKIGLRANFVPLRRRLRAVADSLVRIEPSLLRTKAHLGIAAE
jgi:N-formylglutamate amidohydrolase